MSVCDTKLTTIHGYLFPHDKCLIVANRRRRNTRKDETEEDSTPKTRRKISEFHGFIAAPTTNLFNDNFSPCMSVAQVEYVYEHVS